MADKVNKTILIADDEPDVRTYLQTLLEDNGFDVLLAENGKIAVEKAIENKPDLITLDVTMPEESGSRALKELQVDKATENIPVIIITGVDTRYKNFIHTRKSVDPPAGYFEKPIDRDEFLAKIKELLKLN
jgi:two-component system, OmpR family, alkaline phosphatase synthesis response regulator PhoP